MEVEVEDRWKKRIQKPIGVYIWTILVFLKFGVLNFIAYFLVIRSIEGAALPQVVVTFSLCAFTAGASIWALAGDNVGRISFMILTPLNLAWMLVLIIPAFSSDDPETGRNALTGVVQLVFLTLWIIGMEWYFMTKKVVAYYHQNG